MKRSIKYLPREKQADLKYLVSMILERIPATEMIILYGSYATGKYVEFDTRIEFGIRTTYMSDYDILVVTSGAKDKDVGQKLDNIEAIYYKNQSITDILFVADSGSPEPLTNRSSERQTPVQFINEDIKKLNRDISDGRYFYSQIKEEGIILYDSGRYKLGRRRKLRYEEITRQAEEYFAEKYKNAEEFFDNAKYNYSKGAYKMSSFMLHQTFENLFYAVRLVYTLENNKMHNLVKLLASVRKYSEEFENTFFPGKSDDDMRLFNLVKSAYVEARYNPGFAVTKKDVESLMAIGARLFILVKELCERRIEDYESSASASA